MPPAKETIGVWFRKGLRLHDNKALAAACSEADHVVPFFILDPALDKSKVGVNRFQFLLESLADLDGNLQKLGTRLLVLRGSPESVLKKVFEGKGPFALSKLYWEYDSDAPARKRDALVEKLGSSNDVECKRFQGHTILDIEKVIAQKGFKRPTTMRDIEKIVTQETGSKEGMVVPPRPIPAPRAIPPLPAASLKKGFALPKISEIYGAKDKPSPTASTLFPGGETAGLQRLAKALKDAEWVCKFEKPKTRCTNNHKDPEKPDTTGLSPYLAWGCLSVLTMWHKVADCYRGRKHAKPPMSLHGQLLFREEFYLLSVAVPNWDKAQNNEMCKAIPWDSNNKHLTAWEQGQTGYPLIDALMRELKETGWMHHLGRHAVSCFLTRGDLYVNWEKGRDVFEKLLLDSDWAINTGNWLWLAGVAPFSMPWFRIYDPAPEGLSAINAYPSNGFIQRFVPELKDMPEKFLMRPWTAPLEVQKEAKCVIGKDYPKPIVDHKTAREANLKKFAAGLKTAKTISTPTKRSSSVSQGSPAKRARTA